MDSQTVLVVDDNKALLALVSEMLKWSGNEFTVLTASDGDAALNLSNKHRGNIELLISDVDMPKMRGPELARVLCTQRPEIKILLISGVGDTSLDPGWRFLRKPFVMSELMQEIGKLLAMESIG